MQEHTSLSYLDFPGPEVHEERLMLVTILHAAWSRVILMRQGEGVGQEEGHIYIVG